MMDSSMVEFHQYIYFPEIQNLAFHLPFLINLGTRHCGITLQVAFNCCSDFQDLLCRRDYSERIIARLAHQIEYVYYGGNRYVSIEGIALEHFSSIDQETSSSYSHSRIWYALLRQFLYHHIKQDTFKTATHSKQIIELMKKINCLGAGCITIQDNIDVCDERCVCDTALYIFNIIAIL